MAITSLSGYGGQNLMLMRNDSSADTLVAMIGSHVGLQVPRSMGGLEDAGMMCGQKRSFYPSYDGPTVEEPEDVDEGGDDFSHHVEKKRRLTFDQVRSLEKNFEVENKLEPERKMQLAKELGLQPRQVAVWFQNRRARWKIKQLERDYEALTLDYNRLKADLEVILREKANLKAEVKRLTGNSNSEATHDGESVDPAQCRSETTSQPSDLEVKDSLIPERNSELISLRNYQTRSSPTVDVASALKEGSQQTTSSDSNSSDVMDADSPRTSDSSSLSTRLPEGQLRAQFPPESFVGPNMLVHGGEDMCDHDLASQVQRAAVKLEDGVNGFATDPSCNFFLSRLDEHSVLPWWDWP